VSAPISATSRSCSHGRQDACQPACVKPLASRASCRTRAALHPAKRTGATGGGSPTGRARQRRKTWSGRRRRARAPLTCRVPRTCRCRIPRRPALGLFHQANVRSTAHRRGITANRARVPRLRRRQEDPMRTIRSCRGARPAPPPAPADGPEMPRSAGRRGELVTDGRHRGDGPPHRVIEVGDAGIVVAALGAEPSELRSSP
jgi:hypothetical protein